MKICYKMDSRGLHAVYGRETWAAWDVLPLVIIVGFLILAAYISLI